jgi:hypothetical protein
MKILRESVKLSVCGVVCAAGLSTDQCTTHSNSDKITYLIWALRFDRWSAPHVHAPVDTARLAAWWLILGKHQLSRQVRGGRSIE